MISETYPTVADQTVYTFTFDLISAAYLTVAIDDVPQTGWALTGTGEVTLASPTSSGSEISFSRTTPISDPLVTFTAPSSIRAQEINLAIDQLLHNLQEQDAISTNSLLKTPSEGAWEGEGLAITNIADPTADDDAATRGWVNGQIVGSGQLPPTGPGDAGKLLGVNQAGSGFTFYAPTVSVGGEMRLALTPQTDTQLRQRSGQITTGKNISFVATASLSIDLAPSYALELDAPQTISTFSGTAPVYDEVANTVQLPAGGKYQLSFVGTGHNLGTAGGPNYTNACVLQICDGGTGQALAAQTIFGGRGVTNLAAYELHSGTFAMNVVVDTSSGARLIDLRAAHFHLCDEYAIDVPAALVIKEVI